MVLWLNQLTYEEAIKISKYLPFYVSMVTLILMAVILFPCFTFASEEDGTFTVEELAQYDGKNGAKAFIALDGIVYDVTNDKKWFDGDHPYCEGCVAGKDLTEIFADAPKGHFKEDFMDRYPIVGRLVESKPQMTFTPTPKASKPTPVAVTPVSKPTGKTTITPTPKPKQTSGSVEKPKPGNANTSAANSDTSKTLTPGPTLTPNPTEAAKNVTTPLPEQASSDTLENPVPNDVKGEVGKDEAKNTTPKVVPIKKMNIKRNFLTRDHIISIGWLSFLLFVLSCGYFIFKRVLKSVCKLADKDVNQYIAGIQSKSLNIHCLLGILSGILALIHIINNLAEITVSVSYVCLLSLLLLCLSGALGKYLKKPPYLKKYWRNTHVALLVIFTVTFLYHLYDKII